MRTRRRERKVSRRKEGKEGKEAGEGERGKRTWMNPKTKSAFIIRMEGK